MLIGQFAFDIGVFNQAGLINGLYSSGEYFVGIVIPAELIIGNRQIKGSLCVGGVYLQGLLKAGHGLFRKALTVIYKSELIIDISKSIGVVFNKRPEAAFCRIQASLLEIGPSFLVYLLLFRRHILVGYSKWETVSTACDASYFGIRIFFSFALEYGTSCPCS